MGSSRTECGAEVGFSRHYACPTCKKHVATGASLRFASRTWLESVRPIIATTSLAVSATARVPAAPTGRLWTLGVSESGLSRFLNLHGHTRSFVFMDFEFSHEQAISLCNICLKRITLKRLGNTYQFFQQNTQVYTCRFLHTHPTAATNSVLLVK